MDALLERYLEGFTLHLWALPSGRYLRPPWGDLSLLGMTLATTHAFLGWLWEIRDDLRWFWGDLGEILNGLGTAVDFLQGGGDFELF